MSDGVTINPGSGGPKIDTEDLGSRGEIQRTKIALGVVDTDNGDVSATNPMPVGGNVASAATDSGNPVKTGSVYHASAPVYTDGQRTDDQADAYGNKKVTNATLQAGEDLPNNLQRVAGSGPAGSTPVGYPVQMGNFDGTNLQALTGNVDTGALITAAAVTTTQTLADQVNNNARGIKVVLDMTTVGTGSVTIAIQGKDIASGKYYTILTGAAVTTNSTNVYTIYPGLTAAANVTANDILPRTWRVVVTANNANATTYKVGASLIL